MTFWGSSNSLVLLPETTLKSQLSSKALYRNSTPSSTCSYCLSPQQVLIFEGTPQSTSCMCPGTRPPSLSQFCETHCISRAVGVTLSGESRRFPLTFVPSPFCSLFDFRTSHVTPPTSSEDAGVPEHLSTKASHGPFALGLISVEWNNRKFHKSNILTWERWKANSEEKQSIVY